MKQACCSSVDVAERTSSSSPPVVVMLVMVAARSANGRCQHFHVSLSSELTWTSGFKCCLRNWTKCVVIAYCY